MRISSRHTSSYALSVVVKDEWLIQSPAKYFLTQTVSVVDLSASSVVNHAMENAVDKFHIELRLTLEL